MTLPSAWSILRPPVPSQLATLLNQVRKLEPNLRLSHQTINRCLAVSRLVSRSGWHLVDFFRVSATFAFTLGKGHVGEALPFQVVITSLAHRASVPIELSHLRLAFEGSFRNVNIQHDNQLKCQASATDEFVQFCTPPLKKADFHDLQGACDLTIFPSTSKVIFLSALPLEAGKIELSKISIGVEVEHFDFEFVFGDYLHQDHAWNLEEKRLSRSEKQSTRSVSVDPKPPRIRIEVLNPLKAFFTGEQVFLDVQISNDEDEESNVDIEITLDDQASPPPILRWGSREEGVKPAIDGKYNGAIKTSLGSMASSEIRRLSFSLQAVSETPQHTLEITANYFLISDPHTPVSTAVSMDMLILRPFEANFNFVPQVKEDAWPNFFVVDEEAKTSKAKGLDQRWAVHAAIASFASTDLILEAVDLQLAANPENAVCNILPNADLRSTASTLFPQEILERTFIMDLQTMSLDDCCTTYFDLQLRIQWRRDTADTPSALTYLHLPEFIVPFSEPRVLASANRERGKLELRYMIENPSMHLLSFSVTMEASEDFAFNGPKATSVQLVPYSRQSILYTLLPLHSRWINPQARIVDVIWNKMLKVQATGDLKGNKDGISIWIDDQR